MNLDALRYQLKIDEGVRLKPYLDTEGKITIGTGRNLTDVGISMTENDFLLSNDIVRTVKELDVVLPWWKQLPQVQQNVLANMTFNLGIGRLLGFKHFLEALKAGDLENAAKEMLDSQWALQVGDRARRLASAIQQQS